MSRDNAEQLLNAAIQQEKATKRKMQKAMSQPRRKVYDKTGSSVSLDIHL